MQIRLVANGHTDAHGTALVTHNERLADPLDPITQALAELTGKRKKSIEDHQEIARREFLGGLYTSPAYGWPVSDEYQGTIGLPAWNVLRCLQDGAKRHKRGPDILRGVSPIGDFAALEYDGPSDPVGLWKDGRFGLRKAVGVQRSRTMRTRPIFNEWRLVLPVEVDATVLDLHTIEFMWVDAGKYAGLGEMRPVYGRFHATVEVVEIAPHELEQIENPSEGRARKRNGKVAGKVAA